MKAIKDELRLIPLLFLGPASAIAVVSTKWFEDAVYNDERFDVYVPLLAGYAVFAIGVAVALKLRLIDR